MFGLMIGSATLAIAQMNPSGHVNAAALSPVQPMPAPSNMAPYGNILYPGGRPSFPSQLGATVRGMPYGYGPGVVGGGAHLGVSGGHPRTVVVPYAYPVFYGGGYGGGYGYDGYAQQAPPTNVTVVVPQQPPPSVIINQTFANGEPVSRELREMSADSPAPSDGSAGGWKSWEPKRSSTQRTTQPAIAPVSAPSDGATYARDGKPTIYLIALRDSTVKQAIGFWLEGNVLAYVTPQASIQRISMDRVDRELSVQLNSERNLEFDPQAR